MDNYESIFHIEPVEEEYISKLLDKDILKSNENYLKTPHDRWRYIYCSYKINISHLSRIAVHQLISRSKIDDFETKLSKIFKIVHISFIGSKKITNQEHKIIENYMNINFNPTITSGMLVSLDTLITNFDTSTDNKFNMGTQCKSGLFGFILSRNSICINGNSIDMINNAYYTLSGKENDQSLTNGNYSNLNIHENNNLLNKIILNI